MKAKLLILIDLFFVTRPLLLVPVWGFAVFGYWRFKGFTLTDLPRVWSLIQYQELLWVAVFSLSVAVVYVLNQVADIDVDRKNSGKPLIASGVVSLKSALVTSVFLSIVSIFLPLLFSKPVISILSILTIIIGVVYSFKPFYFSGRPFFDFLSNATGYGVIAFGAGWSIAGGDFFCLEFFRASLPYFFLMSAGSISSTMPDRPGDLESSKNTTAVVFGNFRAHLLALLFLLGSCIVAIIDSDIIVILCFAGSFPFYLGYIFKPDQFWTESTYKAGGALCMVCAGILVPVMIPAAMVVFFLTWLYFRIRHGVSYPALVPGDS